MSDLPFRYHKAELIKGVVSLVTQHFPRECLREDTVVIKPYFSGVCRADIKEVMGSRDIPTDRGPLFGHEFVGSVVFSGASSGFRSGDLVTFNPNITSHRTTGFAEYVFIHGQKKQLTQAVVQIPEVNILSEIWMPEPIACVVHATRRLLVLTGMDHLNGKRVGILGAGCCGLMFAMYARHLGASVKVFNRGAMRRNFAVKQALLTKSEICAFTDMHHYLGYFDIVIVAPTAVTTEMLENAANISSNGGVLHIYGGTREGDRFLSTSVDIDRVRRREQIEPVRHQDKTLKISGAYGCSKEDYEESFRLHALYPKEFPLEKLVSKEISLSEFPTFMMNIAAGLADFPGKVVVKTG